MAFFGGQSNSVTKNSAAAAAMDFTNSPDGLELVHGSQVQDACGHFAPDDAELNINVKNKMKGIQPNRFEEGIEAKHVDDQTQSKRNVVLPPLAKKIAASVAVLGATIAGPTQGLFSQLSGSPDFMEVACAEDSSLTTQMESLGYACRRINFKQGYDLSRPAGTAKLRDEMVSNPPRFTWISLPCTRLSPLQNLTE